MLVRRQPLELPQTADAAPPACLPQMREKRRMIPALNPAAAQAARAQARRRELRLPAPVENIRKSLAATARKPAVRAVTQATATRRPAAQAWAEPVQQAPVLEPERQADTPRAPQLPRLAWLAA